MSEQVTRYRVVPFVEGDHPLNFLGFPASVPGYKNMPGFASRLLLALHLSRMKNPILTYTNEHLFALARDYGVLPKRIRTFDRGITLLIERGYLVPLDGEESEA
jgi:hypothetical protein